MARVGTSMTTAIVTGASRGLGLGIAQRLAATGRTVVLAARGEEELQAAAESVGGVAVRADVTSPEDVERLVAVAAGHGPIDVLVNNAGALPVLDPFGTLTADAFRRGFDVDVVGALLTAQAAAPHLAGDATIVDVVVAQGGRPAGPLHLSVSPAGAAHLALSRQLGAILGPDGVAVHALLPKLSVDGEVGRIAAPALGYEFGPDDLTAADVGDAVVALLERRTGSTWIVEPGARLVESA